MGLGYRFAREVLAKGVFQRTVERGWSEGPDRRTDLFATQLSILF